LSGYGGSVNFAFALFDDLILQATFSRDDAFALLVLREKFLAGGFVLGGDGDLAGFDEFAELVEGLIDLVRSAQSGS
jgi:hypothetical protein